MKQLLLSISVLISIGASAQVLLDQSTALVSGGIASQDFETASNQYDCAAADDFTVPTGTSWTVDSIFIYGQYSGTATTVCPARLTIYTDSGGFPHDVYYEQEWTEDIDTNGDGDLLLVLDCPVQLPAQRYWLSVRSTKTFGSGGGQWYWTRDSIGAGLHYKWHNVGGGFGTSCSTFTTMTTCVSSIIEPGTGFVIYGCAGGPNLGAFQGDTTVCQSDSLVLTAHNGGLSNAQYNWNTGDSIQQIQVNESGFYNVSVTDPNTNCYSTSCVNIIVNENPEAGFLSNDTVCDGEQTTFTGFAVCNGNCVYMWNGDTGAVFHITGQAGWHTLKIIDDANGCESQLDSAWLEVESTAPPALTPGNEIDICEGDTEYLATVDQYTTYEWSTSETTQGIYITDDGTYFVTVTTPSGCSSQDSAVVSVRPAPQPVIVESTTSTFKTKLKASEGYQSYLWSNEDDDVSITVSKSGTYTVTVTDEFGCEGIAEITVSVIPAGIENAAYIGANVFPNPAQNNLTIEWNADGEKSIEMRDVSGRVVKQLTSEERIQNIDITALPNGYYLLNLESDKGSTSVAIVKN